MPTKPMCTCSCSLKSLWLYYTQSSYTSVRPVRTRDGKSTWSALDIHSGVWAAKALTFKCTRVLLRCYGVISTSKKSTCTSSAVHNIQPIRKQVQVHFSSIPSPVDLKCILRQVHLECTWHYSINWPSKVVKLWHWYKRMDLIFINKSTRKATTLILQEQRLF